ncbi:MAG: hypothetical protein KGJ06_08655, partial [Pseudomonadota bacterium]|nr:hypothetical protein [Pseudomonadota bacterium]
DFMQLKPGWEDTLRPYRIDGMIIGRDMRFAHAWEEGLYHDDWQLVFAGSAVNVYILRQRH